jgi:hypothetical protein
MSDKGKVTVHVKFEGTEQTFSGSVEDVWLSLNRFFGEFLPSFEVARRLVLSVDLQTLIKDCVGVVAFSKEGANVLVSKDRLTDNECLLLWLLAGYVGFRCGLVSSDCVGKDALALRLGKSGKIAGTRLGELVKDGLVVKADNDDGFKLSTFGAVQMQKDTIPRIKAKMTSS